MVKKVKFQIPIQKVGDSYYLHLGKHIREQLHIENGVILGGSMYNVEYINITCPVCGINFAGDIDEDVYDCPACSEEIKSVRLQNGTDGK